MSELTALQRAVKLVGGQSALARAVKVRQGHVWSWLNRSKRVPPEYAMKVEAATGGKVSKHELRPDLYQREVRAS